MLLRVQIDTPRKDWQEKARIFIQTIMETAFNHFARSWMFACWLRGEAGNVVYGGEYSTAHACYPQK